jgi:hypothetical protein
MQCLGSRCVVRVRLRERSVVVGFLFFLVVPIRRSASSERRSLLVVESLPPHTNRKLRPLKSRPFPLAFLFFLFLNCFFFPKDDKQLSPP